MRVKRVYLEAGVTEDGNVILEEITDDVLVVLNLLKNVNPISSESLFAQCHREADLLQAQLMIPLPVHEEDALMFVCPKGKA